MDLKNLTPKDEMLYKTAMESKDKLFEDLMIVFSSEKIDEIEEIIKFISRAEYKRGKADGFALRGN